MTLTGSLCIYSDVHGFLRIIPYSRFCAYASVVTHGFVALIALRSRIFGVILTLVFPLKEITVRFAQLAVFACGCLHLVSLV